MHGVPAHMLGELVKPTVATAGRGERASTADSRFSAAEQGRAQTIASPRSDDDIAQCMERLMEVLDHICPSCSRVDGARSSERQRMLPSAIGRLETTLQSSKRTGDRSSRLSLVE